MPPLERPLDRARRRSERLLREIGEEFRNARLRLGPTQQEVADAARISRPVYSKVERAKLASAAVPLVCDVGAVLGVDVSFKGYPSEPSIRDARQGRALKRLIEHVGRPLHWRTEAVLPANPDRPELRSWDLVVTGHGRRTGIEFEGGLYDAQAQLRRWKLKWRDDPVDSLLVVVADNDRNRRVLRQFGDSLFADFPRQRTSAVLAALRRGEHPPTGLILLEVSRPANRPKTN